MREPAVAGSFYPKNPDDLLSLLGRFFKEEKEPQESKGRLKGIIVPHAGYIYSGPVATIAYKLFKRFKNYYDEIILLGPSHYAAFYGLAESGEDSWKTPLGVYETWSLKKRIDDEKHINIYPSAHAPEHDLEVQLPFLQYIGWKGKVCPILTGRIEPALGAMLIEKGIRENTFLIISSDLSHYLPYDIALEKDRITCELIEKKDLRNFEIHGDACGKTGIAILLALARKKNWSINLLDYRNSGDTAGPKDAVVGYGSFAVFEE